MTNRTVHLTQEGYNKFDAELKHLRDVRRSEVAKRLHQALEEGGDLIENAEYEDAKNEQAFVEGRIRELETLFSHAEIIPDSDIDDGIIRLNSVVTVQEEGYEAETFRMVGKAEANTREGKISNESPLGKALMGSKVGDSVTIDAPDGQFAYTIISVK